MPSVALELDLSDDDVIASLVADPSERDLAAFPSEFPRDSALVLAIYTQFLTCGSTWAGTLKGQLADALARCRLHDEEDPVRDYAGFGGFMNLVAVSICPPGPNTNTLVPLARSAPSAPTITKFEHRPLTMPHVAAPLRPHPRHDDFAISIVKSDIGARDFAERLLTFRGVGLGPGIKPRIDHIRGTAVDLVRDDGGEKRDLAVQIALIFERPFHLAIARNAA